MRNPLLFILLLNTECVASVDVLGCLGGWVEFHFKYATNQTYEGIEVSSLKANKTSNKSNEWEKVEKYDLYHNRTGSYLRLHVKELAPEDFGEYECTFGGQGPLTFLLRNDSRICNESVSPDTDTTTGKTINCTHQDFNFICKESLYTCGMILRGPSLVYTISDVSSGVYWCGYESLNDGYRVSRRKIVREGMEFSESTNQEGEATNRVIIIIACVCGSVLLIVPVALYLRKRFGLCSKRRQESTQMDTFAEDDGNIYSEVEDPQNVYANVTAEQAKAEDCSTKPDDGATVGQSK